jgi:membrane-associated protease RseP (regulator of RpoE activity)
MKKLTLLIFVMLLTGPVLAAEQKAGTAVPGDSIRRAVLGCAIARNDDGMVVVAGVLKNSHAEKAGLEKGDILKIVNDKPIMQRIDVLEAINGNSSGDTVTVTVDRYGKARKLSFKLQYVDIPKDLNVLRNILFQEKPVHLAVVIGDINNSAGPMPDLDEWKKGVKMKLAGDWENFYLTAYKAEKNFQLIDRDKIDRIVKEKELKESGLASDNPAGGSGLGQLLGATHIVVIGLSRFKGMDVISRRLIDVSTGKVLASVTREKAWGTEPGTKK